ncbi:hypothetical protein DL93DRAFT_1780818 [Clavulina sp. PMI_390]|nr:hypothetical protein DL93DRAFT_1780818 [Clavulina sp. PMI_390]
MPPDNEPPSERLAPSTELIKAIHNTQVTKPLPSEPPTNNSDPSSPRSDATIRDALLWGAAFVPFLALALLPRRSQLNKLRGDIHALSRQSSKQSKLALEAITALRSNQEELRQSLAQTSAALTRLEELQAHASSKHGAALHYIHRAIANDIKTSREQEQAERLAVDQVAVQALEEARNHLLASRR